MDKLLKKRKQIKSCLTRIESFFVQNESRLNVDINEYITREQYLIRNFEEYCNIQSQIEELDESQENDRPEIENKYFSLLSKLKAKIGSSLNVRPHTDKDVNTSDDSVQQSQRSSNIDSYSKINLPKLDTPKYSGKYEDWNSFIDLFTALIDKNLQLSKVQKFVYLKTSLEKEPLTLINNLQLTEANYDIALNLLKKRYDNNLIIINSHLKGLFDMSQMTKGDSFQMRAFLTNVKQHLDSLKALNTDVQHWDLILVYLFSKKLDFQTQRAYELEKDLSSLPTVKDFLSFLERRCVAFENISPLDKGLKLKVGYQSNTSFKSSLHTTTPRWKCIYCNLNNHDIYRCNKFKALSVDQRKSLVQDKKLCYNCLGTRHLVENCQSRGCKTCNGRHNTLLHSDAMQNRAQNYPNSQSLYRSQHESNSQTQNHDMHSQNNNSETSPHSSSEFPIGTQISGKTSLITNKNHSQVLLATAIVKIEANNGTIVHARALLDCASQSTFVTHDLVKRLGASIYTQNLQISGIGNTVTQTTNMVELLLHSESNKTFRATISCALMDKITCCLPHTTVDTTKIKIPPHITLADPKYFKPSNIDILLGADIYYDLILPGLITLGKHLPTLQNSKLGWIIGGHAPAHTLTPNFAAHFNVSLFCNSSEKIDDLLSKFWQLEQVSEKIILSPSDKYCEDLFLRSITTLVDGSLQVDLPLKTKNVLAELGDSFAIASQRFYYLEKRLEKNTNLKHQYKEFIDEYVELGHGKLIDFDANNPEHIAKRNFLPHQCVIRELSETTKLRVVFDASCKLKSGLSLNDLMYKGFTVQPELFDILCRFRTFKFVILTDIVKMYRAIKVNPNQHYLQNILWRDSPKTKLQCIELQTLTYGTNNAPYLATRTLNHVAENNKSKYPLAAKALLEQTYLDDILSGADSLSEAIQLRDELIQLLESSGFRLHKWKSNNEALLEPFLSDNSPISLVIKNTECSDKILGLLWDCKDDVFRVTQPTSNFSNALTKRQILSYISQMFDPLGFVGPIIVVAKMLIQEIWAKKLDWDERLPNELLKRWQSFSHALPQLANFKIPRYLFSSSNIKEIQIHGFSDASLKAYGACIYVRCLYKDNSVTCRLLCSKSRIAPLKTVSLPRLELCGALLLSKLMHRVHKILLCEINKVVLWTDSQIVLCWLKSEPSRWTIFVANRVAEIQEISLHYIWKYVKSAENPADCLSRGLEPSEIIKHSLWMTGPKFLERYETNFTNDGEIKLDSIPEQKTTVHLQQTVELFPWNRFSKFSKLHRSLSYCIRFIQNTKNSQNKITGPLTVSELNGSLLLIVKLIQQESFANEIQTLRSGNDSPGGRLITLNPILDKNGLLRVNGRLTNADITYEQKFPLILPSNNHVVRLLIEQEHVRLGHAGAQLVLANLRLRYWPLRGIREVKSAIKNCVICHRLKAISAEQLMGSLPHDRVTACRPFLKVGIDFGGPILIKQSRIRKSITTKGYIALFVCMVTKAVHIELVSSLSTEAFLLTLKRFIARRGFPHTIYSDNATNFQGANNKLRDIYRFFKSERNLDTIRDFLSSREINWKFIPPVSPHWGGLWESSIKSAKYYLKRIIGNYTLTFEELSTVLSQIEAIINSRPLCPISSDPRDLSCLTPSHFLIGEPLTSFPEHDVSNLPDNTLKFWNYCSKIRQHFWKRWSLEYLNRLQQRPKWFKTSENLKPDMIVILKEDHAPPLCWPLARILEVLPGKDNKVRLVRIISKSGIFLRPITKICPLPFNNVEDKASTGGRML